MNRAQRRLAGERGPLTTVTAVETPVEPQPELPYYWKVILANEKEETALASLVMVGRAGEAVFYDAGADTQGQPSMILAPAHWSAIFRGEKFQAPDADE